MVIVPPQTAKMCPTRVRIALNSRLARSRAEIDLCGSETYLGVGGAYGIRTRVAAGQDEKRLTAPPQRRRSARARRRTADAAIASRPHSRPERRRRTSASARPAA